MSGSTWTWIGGTINLASPTDWTLTAGPGNVTEIPETGDTAINNGTLVGYGLIAAALVNNGTVEASNDSVPSSSTGGDLEIQGAVSGTGSVTIAPGATLQIDGALAAGQAIAFGTGAPEKLILGSPTGTISNPIIGFTNGDLFEFPNGFSLTSASVKNTNTLLVTYTNNVMGVGTYDLTNVTFAAGTSTYLGVGYDVSTGYSTVGPAGILTWIGGSGTNFNTAANWGPASVPSLAGFVLFNNRIGGTISGTGITGGFNFYNTGTWALAPGTSLTAAGFLNIGIASEGEIPSPDALTIGTGSTITDSGGIFNVGRLAGNIAILTVKDGGLVDVTAPGNTHLSAMGVGTNGASGTLAAASGTVFVTGNGSTINLGLNGLSLGANGGNGSVTVSLGGTVIAATTNSSLNTSMLLGGQGSGTLTVTDPGSQATATGVVDVAQSGSGTLIVENSGTFLEALDPTGQAGLTVGDGSPSGVGGTGTATVTGGGNLISQGYVIVGLRGDAGLISVLNGGTVEVGTTLTVGTGGTLSNGTTHGGNGNPGHRVWRNSRAYRRRTDLLVRRLPCQVQQQPCLGDKRESDCQRQRRPTER